MPKVRRQLVVKILVEDDISTMERTLGYIKTSVKNSCRNLASGAVVLGLYDENDHLVGLDITGRPSPAMEEVTEDLFNEE